MKNIRFVQALILILALSFCTVSFGEWEVNNGFDPSAYDRFGGWKGVKAEAEKFFSIKQLDGKWWFITPDGNGFISKGVNVFWTPGSKELETILWLKSLGINSVGAWSKKPRKFWKPGGKIARFRLLNFIRSYKKSRWRGYNRKKPPDIFTTEFVNSIEKQARKKVKPFASDPFLVGWWTDNELYWAGENPPILDTYLKFGSEQPGRMAAEEYLQENFGSPSLPVEKNELQEARDGFIEVVVRRYAETTTQAIRKYDKNHLILGARLMFTPIPWKKIMPKRMEGFEALARGAKGYWDILSVNCYFDDAPIDRLKKLYESFNGPVLISEFNTWSANKDNGKKGEEEWMARTRISAAGYEEQIPVLMAEPYMVGYHFFPYVNYKYPKKDRTRPGLVNYKHEPREMLVNIFRTINQELEEIHIGEE